MSRFHEVLKKRYLALVYYYGSIIAGVGLLILSPLLLLPFRPGESGLAPAFLFTALPAITVGVILRRSFRDYARVALSVAEGGVLVIFSWAGAIILSSLPFVLSGTAAPLDALFESISGWTTTGLSVMDVSILPDTILLWRSIMQLAGGLGLAVIMLAAIIGPYGTGLYQAEGRNDYLLPHIRRSTALIVRIYIGYTIAGIVLYFIAGMPMLEAINHAMAALSTGGFSTRVGSIGEYANFSVEIITIVLMLLGTTNFVVHYLLLRGQFRLLFRQGEPRLMILLLAIFIPFILVFAVKPIYGYTSGLRIAAFEAVSALSTTGFSTVGYSNWSDAGILAMVILMLIGGGAGSTAGGIKLYRVYLLGRSFIWDLKRYLLPRNAVPSNYVWHGSERLFVDSGHVKEIGSYVVLYLATWFFGILALVLQEIPIREAMFEFSSALGTVGLSIGMTAPGAPAGLMAVLMTGMLLGRLEFLVIFYAAVKLVKDMKTIQVKR